MAKFSGNQKTNVRGAVQTTQTQIQTHEGAVAWERTPESELFVLAITNMVGEDTFYEKGGVRDTRFVELIHKVTGSNPDFIAGKDPENGQIGFAEFLRRDMGMRSASAVMAVEYIAAGGHNGRSVVNRVLQRPDEPAEILGYWISTRGRKRIPKALERGIGDAVSRLYNEWSVGKYDGQARDIRMGDVIEIVHPTPRGEWQSKLFKYLLSTRHRGSDARVSEELSALPKLALAKELDRTDGPELLSRLNREPDLLSKAGWTWERLSGKTQMDDKAWSLVIPNMGVMALLRNLRNFDQAEIPEALVDYVIGKITDPEEVKKSRIFPYQVWSAYSYAPSDNWKRALGKTLDLTTQNIPEGLDRSLIVIDCSGSMGGSVSGKSKLARWEVAAVMGGATAKGTKDTDIVVFGESNLKLDIIRGTSVLGVVERIKRVVDYDEVGSSTFGHTAIRDHWDPAKYKRVILFTDDQMWDSTDGTGPRHAYSRRYGYGAAVGGVDISHVPLVFTFNLGGYKPSALQSGENGRYTLGGFSDATFKAIELLERGKDANWPF